jgi:uncharacterized membrane protein
VLVAALAEATLIQVALHHSIGQILGVALATATALLVTGWLVVRRD